MLLETSRSIKYDLGFKGPRGQGPQGGVNGLEFKTLEPLKP